MRAAALQLGELANEEPTLICNKPLLSKSMWIGAPSFIVFATDWTIASTSTSSRLFAMQGSVSSERNRIISQSGSKA